MAGNTVRVPFCGKEMVLELPDTWEVTATPEPRRTPKLADIRAGLMDAPSPPKETMDYRL
ncbi:MAG: hypothetical protein ISR64_01435 [Deltaproteobacteria bacterium]|nr:hypothetical protein [Deltaproteobacteria bacterium]